MNKHIVKSMPAGFFLSAAYPRLALDIIDREAGLGPARALDRLELRQSPYQTEFVAIETHLKIIELGRSLMPDFSKRMAVKCGINTLGPLVPAILSARCGREAWLIASIYIPILDNTVNIDFIERVDGAGLQITRTIDIGIENEIDFSMAGFHVASAILSAGLTSIDFQVNAKYYNMGELPPVPDWGAHMAASDAGPPRVELSAPSDVVDVAWFASTESNMRSEIDRLDDLLETMNKKPGMFVKLEKALSSARVEVGNPLAGVEEICDYMHMAKESIDNRLRRSSTTLLKIRRHHAVKHAVALARTTDLPWDVINDLTTQVSTVSNMNKLVKSQVGATPKEIRDAAL